MLKNKNKKEIFLLLDISIRNDLRLGELNNKYFGVLSFFFFLIVSNSRGWEAYDNDVS